MRNRRSSADRADAPRGAATTPASKPCAVCGRTITWRRAWARDWQAVRYCSDACRRRARSAVGRDVDAQLDGALAQLLDARAASASVCPSEVARAVGGDDDWRSLMEPARAAARRLVAAGGAQITQGGRVVDPSTAKGPIRIRRPR